MEDRKTGRQEAVRVSWILRRDSGACGQFLSNPFTQDMPRPPSHTPVSSFTQCSVWGVEWGWGRPAVVSPIRQSGLPVAAVTHEVTHLSDRRFQKRIQKAENVELVASGTKDNITQGPPRWRTCTGHVFAVSTPVRMQAPRPTTDLRRLQHPMEVLNSKEFYGLGQTSHLSADKIKQLIYRLERKGVVDGCSLCCWYFTFLCYEDCFLLPVMTEICRSLM